MARAVLTNPCLSLQDCFRACQPFLMEGSPEFPGYYGNEEPLALKQQQQEEEEEEEEAVRAGLGLKQNKRSYSMEHFRWGKPVGKKRRPIKITPTVPEDQPTETLLPVLKRDLAGDKPGLAFSPDSAEIAEAPDLLLSEAAKKDGVPYRMEHFRWGSPPKDKRYGGFMGSEKSQMPLVTLFRNAIIKNAHKKGQ